MQSVPSSAGDATAEDSDESSSSSSITNAAEHTPTTTTTLKQFREQWHHELYGDQTDSNRLDLEFAMKKDKNSDHENANIMSISFDSAEEQAKFLFQEGTELEKLGKVFEAMRLYRRAVQIVPDIEFKMYETLVKQTAESSNVIAENEHSDTKYGDNKNKQNDDENLDGVDLMERFQLSLQKCDRVFQCAINTTDAINSTTIFSGGLHISDLPLELILYILRWVVSTDLDIRSLEQCSLVSKGFYICARDSEIWRLACVKIWGVNIGSLNCFPYISWRHMFLERCRVHFNGCYISKTNYFRYGENSFQDQFYRPVQLIEYYRYIRFFPDGQILMMTSTDEPAQGVAKLRLKDPTKNEILKGHYRLHGDMVIIVLKRNRMQQPYKRSTGRGRGINTIDEIENHTFFLELKIISSSKRRFNQLQWKHYSIIQQKSKDETSTDFEITPAKYPALYFSRVKSYHLVSEQPLQ